MGRSFGDVLSSRQVGTLRERITKAGRPEILAFVKSVDSLRTMAVERLLNIIKEEEREKSNVTGSADAS